MNEWVANEIEKIARFSQAGQGVTRLTLSDEAKKARQYVASLMTEAGLKVRIDAIGNVIGCLSTDENYDSPAVITGSHLDTAPYSSKVEGTLGILSAIAAVKALKAKGPLRHPIEVIAFAGEESGRFGLSMLGSKVAAGSLREKTLAAAKDKQGISLSQALAWQGFDFKNAANAKMSASCSKAFLELYAIPSQMLKKEGAAIGIAEQIAGLTKCKITVNGTQAHGGWTPMDERQDALVSAAMIVLAVQEIAQEAEAEVLATVSDVKVLPGTPDTVPGRVEMWVSISGEEQEDIIEALQEIKDAVSAITESQETAVAIEIFSAEKPVKLSHVVAAAIEEAAKKSGISHTYINSGSRHDAASMSGLMPSGILFVPYDKAEDNAAMADIQRGLTVLTETLYQLAK